MLSEKNNFKNIKSQKVFFQNVQSTKNFISLAAPCSVKSQVLFDNGWLWSLNLVLT